MIEFALYFLGFAVFVAIKFALDPVVVETVIVGRFVGVYPVP